jgi:hypothetical protein
MDAVRAYQRSFHLTVEIGFDSLKIGAPAALGFVVGMTDVVPD